MTDQHPPAPEPLPIVERILAVADDLDEAIAHTRLSPNRAQAFGYAPPRLRAIASDLRLADIDIGAVSRLADDLQQHYDEIRAGVPHGAMTGHTAGALAVMDEAVDRLRVIAGEEPEISVRSCRKCGCTDMRACPGGCSWVSDDLCSACSGGVELTVDEYLGAASVHERNALRWLANAGDMRQGVAHRERMHAASMVVAEAQLATLNATRATHAEISGLRLDMLQQRLREAVDAQEGPPAHVLDAARGALSHAREAGGALFEAQAAHPAGGPRLQAVPDEHDQGDDELPTRAPIDVRVLCVICGDDIIPVAIAHERRAGERPRVVVDVGPCVRNHAGAAVDQLTLRGAGELVDMARQLDVYADEADTYDSAPNTQPLRTVARRIREIVDVHPTPAAVGRHFLDRTPRPGDGLPDDSGAGK